MPPPRASGRFALLLDDIECGIVHSAEGGGIVGEVVSRRGPDYFDEKHLANLRYEELVLQVDLSLHASVYAWVAGTLTGGRPRHKGAVAELARPGAPLRQREFFGALLTEVTFPALDASSKDAAYLTLKLAPEYTRTNPPAGKPNPPATTGSPLRRGSFRLEIDGLDCSRVHEVGALTVRQVREPDTGEGRDPDLLPTRLVFPDLSVALSESGAQTWVDWRDDFLVRGNNTAAHERQGRLSLLAADGKRVLAELRLVNLGILRLEPVQSSAGDRELAASLYCERLELTVNP